MSSKFEKLRFRVVIHELSSHKNVLRCSLCNQMRQKLIEIKTHNLRSPMYGKFKTSNIYRKNLPQKFTVISLL